MGRVRSADRSNLRFHVSRTVADTVSNSYGSEGWEFESLRARTSYSTADQRRRYEARSDMMALMDLCPSDCPTPVTQVVKVLAHQAGEVQRCIRRSTGTSPVRDRFGSSNCVDVYSALCNNRISQMPVWTIGAGSAYGTRLALRACRRGFLLRDWVRAGRTFRTGSALPWSGGNTRNWCDNDGASVVLSRAAQGLSINRRTNSWLFSAPGRHERTVLMASGGHRPARPPPVGGVAGRRIVLSAGVPTRAAPRMSRSLSSFPRLSVTPVVHPRDYLGNTAR
jgi:hypothetical protein